MIPQPSVLLSYHFWRNADVGAALSEFPVKPWVFADSGAFSAQAALGGKAGGAEVTLDGYLAWLDRWREHIDVACTIDQFFDYEATDASARALVENGHVPVPVFHVTEPWEWLHRWAEAYPYVGLGGQVPWSTNVAGLQRWLVKALRITREHGAVTHGLGQTNLRMLQGCPFYSCDSSSWVAFQRFGNLMLWDDVTQRLVPATKATLTPRAAALLRSHGVDPQAFRHPSFGRGAAGAAAARHGADRGRSSSVAVAERRLLRLASMRSWIEVEQWMRRRHGLVPLAGSAPGPHVCLVLAGPDDAADFNRALRAHYEQELTDA